MNDFVFYLIVALLCIAGILMIVRGRIVVSLSKCNANKEWQKMIDITETKLSRILLSQYVRDLNVAKAYLLKGDISLLKKHLRVMMQKKYQKGDQEQYLTLYYHMFLIQEDYDFALEILETIKKSDDAIFIKYSVWSKEVVIDKRDDLIDTMDKAIENKDFYAFPLGVVSYLIALQRIYQEDYKEASVWLEACILIFQKHDIYVNTVNKKIKEIQVFLDADIDDSADN